MNDVCSTNESCADMSAGCRTLSTNTSLLYDIPLDPLNGLKEKSQKAGGGGGIIVSPSYPYCVVLCMLGCGVVWV